MGARVVLESKHPCRLGGDRSLPASLSGRSQRDLELMSKAPSIGEKLEMPAGRGSILALRC
jgi:hypothetical protein